MRIIIQWQWQTSCV